MPDYGATDRVRRFVLREIIEPARRRGEQKVTIHAGTLGKLLQGAAIHVSSIPQTTSASSSDDCSVIRPLVDSLHSQFRL